MDGRNESVDKTSVNAGMMLVESVALAFPTPGADMVARVTNGDAALDATLTETVMGG